MTQHYDLEEQEQLERVKLFWKQHGNRISTLVLLVCLGFAGWNGYNYWQKNQAMAAATLYDNSEKIFQSGDVKAAERVFADMGERYKGSFYTAQAGLRLAKLAYENGQADVAKNALQKVVDNASDAALVAAARLRLAQVLMEQKAYDQAQAQLTAKFPAGFDGLVADAQGDLYNLQGKTQEAVGSYQKALAALDANSSYRVIVDAKLATLGGAAEPTKP
ncbi:tetratricopeptide repeat protein [Curvibacter sp. CHRR-16]|uniref:YfgM family protein n=1 Tax=Curvibacter sp. CHRR-16 TaxID=2835872 RepID=UPI001BDB0C4B|nr:tetratricopeptide repeat protein [Curvibacter sp. CHRR-16]MBT0569236.1 tetratricopeptide repeat protein [Curvibacter sp. CHRR-16]